MTLRPLARCHLCGAGFEPNRIGRPRFYCGARCRQDAARYAERLPAWLAELAQYEADAAGWRAIHRPVPVDLRNRIAHVHVLIARHGPKAPSDRP